MDTNEFLQRLPTDQSYRDARFAIEYATRMQDESQLEHDAALVDEEVRAARTIEDLDAVHGLLAIAGFMAIAGMTLEGPDHARKILALHSLRDQYARISGEFVELESIAHQDHLTGRLNRHGMYAWAKKHYKPQENSYGVFFLDFEKFKTINDILGHRVGDTTLRDAIDYISTKIRTGHKKPNDVISVE
jgi:predicted signal transduction protein with EAL and GGDEF domain